MRTHPSFGRGVGTGGGGHRGTCPLNILEGGPKYVCAPPNILTLITTFWWNSVLFMYIVPKSRGNWLAGRGFWGIGVSAFIEKPPYKCRSYGFSYVRGARRQHAARCAPPILPIFLRLCLAWQQLRPLGTFLHERPTWCINVRVLFSAHMLSNPTAPRWAFLTTE